MDDGIRVDIINHEDEGRLMNILRPMRMTLKKTVCVENATTTDRGGRRLHLEIHSSRLNSQSEVKLL
jgi:hypothetical protein